MRIRSLHELRDDICEYALVWNVAKENDSVRVRIVVAGRLARKRETHGSNVDESYGPLGEISVVLDIRDRKLIELDDSLCLDTSPYNGNRSAKVGPNRNDALRIRANHLVKLDGNLIGQRTWGNELDGRL